MTSLGRRRASLLAALSLGVSLAGCQQFYELRELNRADPETQAEAGSTHAFGVAYPWRTFVDGLQPTFPMTPELALASSLPTTASFTARTVEAFQAQIAAGLPGSTVAETEKRVVGADGAVTRTEERTRSTTPGEAPAFPPTLGAPSGAAALPVLATALQREPFLLYSAANDLFQEVQILNQAIRKLPVGRGVVPYLVRLKVSSLAYRRQLGFDIYSDITFFNEKPAWAKAHRRGEDGWPSGAMLSLPYVVPLLVTDGVELASDAVTAEALLSLAAAVTGTAGNAGLGGQVQAMRQSLNQALANSSNALRTVVRLGDNSLRVRLGATYRAGPFGTKAYDQSTRTHNISALVLVPEAAIKEFAHGGPDREEPRIRAVALTSLRNVKSGELLPTRNWDETFADRIRIRDGFKLPRRVAEHRLCTVGGQQTKQCKCDNNITDACVIDWDRVNATRLLDKLREHSLNGRFEGFVRDLRAHTRGFSPEQELNYLWSELARNVGNAHVAVFTIPLPTPPARCLPPTGQLVVLRDDKKATVAQLSGLGGYEAGEVSAVFTVPDGAQAPTIPHSAVAVSENLLTVSFPSLNALGLVKPPTSDAAQRLPGNAKLTVRAFKEDEECESKEPRGSADFAPVRYVLTEPAKVAKLNKTVVSAASIVAGADGTGQVSVGLDFDPGNPKRSALVWVEGAEVTAASAGQLDGLGRVRLEAPGYVALTLRNLAPGTKVGVRAVMADEKGAGPAVDPAPFASPVVVAAPGTRRAEAGG